jgi:hypothetical protein
VKRTNLRCLRNYALGGLVLIASVSQTALAQQRGYTFSPVSQYDIKLTAAYWNPFAAYGLDKEVEFAGNQNAAFAQIFSGKASTSASNSQLVEGYTRREGKKFRVQWTSESFQALALMASSQVPDKGLKAVSAAYFVPASAADYAAYKRFYQTAPVSLH